MFHSTRLIIDVVENIVAPQRLRLLSRRSRLTLRAADHGKIDTSAERKSMK